MIVVEFFRDVFDGVWYILYLLGCIIAFFFVLGIVADNKRARINKKLKEKKTYDIESGREAQIAAMESKQILSVNDSETTSGEANQEVPATQNVAEQEPKKEEVPTVMILNSNDQKQAQPAVNNATINNSTIQPPVQSATDTPQKKVEEPLILNSSSN